MLSGEMDDLPFNLGMAFSSLCFFSIVLNNLLLLAVLKWGKANNMTNLQSKTNYFLLCFTGRFITELLFVQRVIQSYPTPTACLATPITESL